MNFDRHHKIKTVQKSSENKNLLGQIQQLPIVKRVYLYIFLVAAIGGVMGEVKYRLDSPNCMTNDNCWTVEPSQRRVRELGLGVIAGAIAATLISIPALLEED